MTRRIASLLPLSKVLLWCGFAVAIAASSVFAQTVSNDDLNALFDEPGTDYSKGFVLYDDNAFYDELSTQIDISAAAILLRITPLDPVKRVEGVLPLSVDKKDYERLMATRQGWTVDVDVLAEVVAQAGSEVFINPFSEPVIEPFVAEFDFAVAFARNRGERLDAETEANIARMAEDIARSNANAEAARARLAARLEEAGFSSIEEVERANEVYDAFLEILKDELDD